MGREKDFTQRDGFLNRHIKRLPPDKTILIEIINNDSDGEHLHVCQWSPYDHAYYIKRHLQPPAHGYLGTCRIVIGRYTGIGFHAWEQNNSEFIYYRIIRE